MMPKIHRDRPPTNRYVPSQKPSRITVTGFIGSETELAAQIDQVLSARALVVDPSPPSRAADKAEWVAYAESVGIDASGTKTQIVERVRND